MSVCTQSKTVGWDRIDWLVNKGVTWTCYRIRRWRHDSLCFVIITKFNIIFWNDVQLNDDNEKLQRQVTAKEGGHDLGADTEKRRLRAENAALQKSLTSK